MSDEWRELAKQVYETGDVVLAERLVAVLRRLATPKAEPGSPTPSTKLVSIDPSEWGLTPQSFGKVIQLGCFKSRGRCRTFDGPGRPRMAANVRDLAFGLRDRYACLFLGEGVIRAGAVRLVRASGLEAPDEIPPSEFNRFYTIHRSRRRRGVRRAVTEAIEDLLNMPLL